MRRIIYKQLQIGDCVFDGSLKVGGGIDAINREIPTDVIQSIGREDLACALFKPKSEVREFGAGQQVEIVCECLSPIVIGETTALESMRSVFVHADEHAQVFLLTETE